MKLISSKEEVYIPSNLGVLSNGIYQRIVLVDDSIVWINLKGNISVKEESYLELEKQYHEALKEMNNEEVKMYLKKK